MSQTNPNVPINIEQLKSECRSLYTGLSQDQLLDIHSVTNSIEERLNSQLTTQAELQIIQSFLTAQSFDGQSLVEFLHNISAATPDSYNTQIETQDAQSHVRYIQRATRQSIIERLENLGQSINLIADKSQLLQTITELKTESDKIHNLIETIKQIQNLDSLDDSDLVFLESLNVYSPNVASQIEDVLTAKNISTNQSTIDAIIDILTQAENLSERFKTLVDNLDHYFEQGLNEINKQKVSINNIHNLERETGLRIREAHNYFYFDREGNQQQFRISTIHTSNISDLINLKLAQAQELIQSTQTPILSLEEILDFEYPLEYLHSVAEQHPESQSELQNLESVITEIQSLALRREDINGAIDPFSEGLDRDLLYNSNHTSIYLEGQLPSGFQNPMSLEAFNQLLTSFNVHEAIYNLQDLKDNIEFSLYGQQIQIGTKLQLSQGRFNPNSDSPSPNYTIFEVTQCNDSDITLQSQDQTLQMTLPEFTKWFRLNRVEELVDLYQARQILRNHPSALKAKYADHLDDSFLSPHPITITEGEVLTARDGSQFVISKIEEDSDTLIHLEDGRQWTVPEFLHYCKDWELQNFNLPQGQDLPSGIEPKSVKDEAKKSGINPFDYLPRINIFFDPLELLELEIVNFKDYKQIASMASEILKNNIDLNDQEKLIKMGKNLPGKLGRKFSDEESSIIGQKIKQEADSISSDTVFDVIGKLKNAPDRYKAKAHMDFLADKGMLNLEDPSFHKTLNRLLNKHKDVVLGNTNKKPSDFIINEFGVSKNGKTAKSSTKAALDALYGKGTGDEIANKQERNYKSEVDNYKGVIAEEFFKIGGLGPEMHEILESFINGEDVHPAKFEGFLDAGIDNGFLSGDEVLFFVVAGMAAESKNGTTLLTDSYIRNIKRGDVPQLDYIARLKDDKTGSRAQGVCKEIFKFFDYKPGKKPPYNKQRVSDFVRLEASQSDKTKKRVSAASKKPFDKEYTGHALPAASPRTMFSILGMGSQYSQTNFDEVRIDDSLEGFCITLRQIAGYESGDSELSKLSHSNYKNLSDGERAENLADVLGSWYLLFSNINPNIVDAYSYPSSIKNYNITKKSDLEPVKKYLPRLLEAFPNEVPAKYIPYILGEKSCRQAETDVKSFVANFYLKIGELASLDPSKFLNTVKGQSFKKQ